MDERGFLSNSFPLLRKVKIYERRDL